MDKLQDMDDFIKCSIDQTLGIDLTKDALQLKIQALEESNYRIRSQYFALKSALTDKNEAIERARAESTLNAQALKRFVEENHRLANECANLVSKCSTLENECSLYHQDREVLMEFGNEADERAKKAEIRVQQLEEELINAYEETQLYKRKCENQIAGSSDEGTEMEQNLLDGLISSLVGGDEVEEMAHSFLQANNKVEICHKLFKMWNKLRPKTRNVLSLAAQTHILHRDKEQLRINLHTAEEEVKLLDEENKKLLRLCHQERKHSNSGGKHNSSTMKKNNKRKESPMSLSPIKNNIESLREPLLSLSENSSDLGIQKK
ncbi:hypothetical protein V2J09_013860 [Rumex salicifolius]